MTFSLEMGLGLWLVLWIFVIWWAAQWGRSVFWAVVGGLILSPILWALVLLVLGRREDD